MVECGSGEGVSSYNFSSPDRPTPYEGIRSISLLYRLMQQRLKGVAGIQVSWAVYMSAWRCWTPDVQKTQLCSVAVWVKYFVSTNRRCLRMKKMRLTILLFFHRSLTWTHTVQSIHTQLQSLLCVLGNVLQQCGFSVSSLTASLVGLCVGLCYSFYSRLEIHSGKTIQTKCFKSNIGFVGCSH